MSHKLHYIISSVIYFLTLWSIIIILPIALILEQYIYLLSLIVGIIIFRFFAYSIHAKCTKNNCNGKIIRTSSWKPSKFFSSGPNYTIYTCEKCNDVHEYREDISVVN